MEQNNISNTPSLELHVIMEHSPSVTNYYRLISMRKFHPSNARRRMPRMNNDHVSLYSEETNVETNAGLVVHLYRIVPHIHSALFSALYMWKSSAIEILVRKRQLSVRFVSYHARFCLSKYFSPLRLCLDNTSIRNKPFWFLHTNSYLCNQILKNVPSNRRNGHSQAKII